MNLVVGATGILGSEICRQLRAAGKPVAALARPSSDPTKVEALRSVGVELRGGDLKDRASLDAACTGVATVISTASSTLSRAEGDGIDSVDSAGQRNLIDAARAAGVQHFIYVSVSGNLAVDSPLIAAKRDNEAYLAASGMAYTILRPSCFMEVWLSPVLGFDAANGNVRIYGSGENPVSWVSFRDVATFAARSVDNPAARNQVFEIGGPEALSQNDVVSLYEEILGRPIEREVIPAAALEQQYAMAQDPMQKSFAGLMVSVANGDRIDMSRALAAVPVQLTSVRKFAAGVEN